MSDTWESFERAATLEAGLRAENERLRAVLNEVVTNGKWSGGEQYGDWLISQDVYAMARAALEPKP